MLCSAVITVYFQNYMEHRSTLCGEKAECLNMRHVVIASLFLLFLSRTCCEPVALQASCRHGERGLSGCDTAGGLLVLLQHAQYARALLVTAGILCDRVSIYCAGDSRCNGRLCPTCPYRKWPRNLHPKDQLSVCVNPGSCEQYDQCKQSVQFCVRHANFSCLACFTSSLFQS